MGDGDGPPGVTTNWGVPGVAVKSETPCSGRLNTDLRQTEYGLAWAVGWEGDKIKVHLERKNTYLRHYLDAI